jgi:hypothetical protein
MRASMRMQRVAPILATTFLTGAAFAGDQTPAPAAATGAVNATAKVEVSASVKITASGFLASLHLPVLAKETREQGVPDDEVKLAVVSLREAKVAPEDAVETFKTTVASVSEKGPVEKFGDLVRLKLKEGLRGKALTKAIHDEHEKRGIGKGKKLRKEDDERPGLHLGQDPEAKAAHMEERGKPEREGDKRSEGDKERAEKPGDKAPKAADKPEKHGDNEHRANDEHGEGKPGKGKEK